MKIFCIGRNYAEHAQELNNPIPEAPVVFMKPPTALLKGNDFYLPEFSKEMHYECELVYRICKNGKHILRNYAWNYIDAITCGIDFTARDIQSAQKKKGLPWEIAKAFDNSAVVGTFQTEFSTEKSYRFSLEKNGVRVQDGISSDMIYPVPQIIEYISQFFTLQQGDLLFTGTPVGVGTVAVGDVLTGRLEAEKMFETIIR